MSNMICSYLELVGLDAVEDEIVLLLLLTQCGQGILGLQMCIGGIGFYGAIV